jgi:hypothetical protein
MKVYLASSYALRDSLVRPMIDRLEGAGITISHDWTVGDTDPHKNADGAARSETLLSREEQWGHAKADLRGVEIADVVWLLLPETGGTGCFIEFGYALAIGKPCLVSGVPRTIFQTHPLVLTWESHEAALASLVSHYEAHVRSNMKLLGWQTSIARAFEVTNMARQELEPWPIQKEGIR